MIGVLGRLKLRSKWRSHRVSRQAVQASVQIGAGTLAIHYGARTMTVAVPDGFDPADAGADFAAFALFAISMSQNIEITLNAPVTDTVARALGDLSIFYGVCAVSQLAPPRLNLPQVVPVSPRQATGRRVLCFSGGVDSTCAAVIGRQERGLTDALLVAGFDYPSADAPGFVDLRDRAQTMADRIGLRLNVLETDFRDHAKHWELLHGFGLLTALYAVRGGFDEGGVGLDSSCLNDMLFFPWGSFEGLFRYASTPDFGIHAYNAQLRRGEKIQRIAEFDRGLFSQVSVCWTDTSTGGNCGKCLKCKRLAVFLQAHGVPMQTVFVTPPDPLALFDGYRPPRSPRGATFALVTMTEAWSAMPEGPEKQAARRHLETLKKRHRRGRPEW